MECSVCLTLLIAVSNEEKHSPGINVESMAYMIVIVFIGQYIRQQVKVWRLTFVLVCQLTLIALFLLGLDAGIVPPFPLEIEIQWKEKGDEYSWVSSLTCTACREFHIRAVRSTGQ